MKKIVCLGFLLISALTISARSQTFFQKVAGNWEGTLEYLDYQENKRVKLKTYLTITPATDGNSAEFSTVYDDFGRIIKDRETVKIDLSTKKYVSGDFEYALDSIGTGKIVLLGNGQDGEKVEPIRETITYTVNSLSFLKETRQPWQFRNQTILTRTTENVLSKRILMPIQLKEDFSILRKALTTIHPGIYRYQTPDGMAKIFDEFEAKLQNPISESDFMVLVSQVTNKIRCGHTFPNPYNQAGLVRERIFNNKNYLPFYFRLIDGRMIVTHDATAQNLSRGSEITKINGVAVSKIIDALLTITKADGNGTLVHRLKTLELPFASDGLYNTFDLYFPLFFPPANERFKIEAVDFTAHKKIKFETPALTKTERAAAMKKRFGKPPTVDELWQLQIQENKTAYLKIGAFVTWRLKMDWKRFLADAFAEMKAKNVENLIIDVRGNGGGDDDAGVLINSYLAKQPIPCAKPKKRFVRIENPDKNLAQYLDTYSDELRLVAKNGFAAELVKKSGNGLLEYVGDKQCEPTVPAFNNFQGKAFIITDAANASAAFQFVNVAQINNLAKIVGQQTGGNLQGINGDNYFFLRLPNSKIEIDIPIFYQSPLNLPQPDSGVIPDVVVKLKIKDVADNIDGELLKVNQLIKNERRRPN